MAFLFLSSSTEVLNEKDSRSSNQNDFKYNIIDTSSISLEGFEFSQIFQGGAYGGLEVLTNDNIFLFTGYNGYRQYFLCTKKDGTIIKYTDEDNIYGTFATPLNNIVVVTGKIGNIIFNIFNNKMDLLSSFSIPIKEHISLQELNVSILQYGLDFSILLSTRNGTIEASFIDEKLNEVYAYNNEGIINIVDTYYYNKINIGIGYFNGKKIGDSGVEFKDKCIFITTEPRKYLIIKLPEEISEYQDWFWEKFDKKNLVFVNNENIFFQRVIDDKRVIYKYSIKENIISTFSFQPLIENLIIKNIGCFDDRIAVYGSIGRQINYPGWPVSNKYPIILLVNNDDFTDTTQILINTKEGNSEINYIDNNMISISAQVNSIDFISSNLILTPAGVEKLLSSRMVSTSRFVVINRGATFIPATSELNIVTKNYDGKIVTSDDTQLWFCKDYQLSNIKSKKIEYDQYFTLYSKYYSLEDRVNIRDQPGLYGKVLFQINKGADIEVCEKSVALVKIGDMTAPWYKILYKGREGWVFSPLIAPKLILPEYDS